jgi:hypothetical protein
MRLCRFLIVDIELDDVCVSVCGDKQGTAAREAVAGVGRGPDSIKEILGENRGTCI